jgi:hypothetical protein
VGRVTGPDGQGPGVKARDKFRAFWTAGTLRKQIKSGHRWGLALRLRETPVVMAAPAPTLSRPVVELNLCHVLVMFQGVTKGGHAPPYLLIFMLLRALLNTPFHHLFLTWCASSYADLPAASAHSYTTLHP